MSTHSGQRWSVQQVLKSREVNHKSAVKCLFSARTAQLVCDTSPVNAQSILINNYLHSVHMSKFSFPCTSLNMTSAVSSDAAFNSNSQAPSLPWPAKKCTVNCISLTHFSAGAKAFLLFNHMALACAEGPCSDLGCSTKKACVESCLQFRIHKQQGAMSTSRTHTQCNNKLDTIRSPRAATPFCHFGTPFCHFGPLLCHCCIAKEPTSDI